MQRGTGRGVKIAVIDSGIELSHPAMANLRLVDDIAFTLSDDGVVKRTANAGFDANGHGTGIAHAIRRIAPEAQIGSFRVLDERNGTKFQILTEAANLACERGYDILSCSFGAVARMDSIGHFKSWIDKAYRRGVHIVSACNNVDFRKPEWPGHFPSIITVNMADTDSDGLYFRSDAGHPNLMLPLRHLVEFAARGVKVELPTVGGRWKKQTGSSFAAPHVAGLLACMISEVPGLKPPVAKALLQEIAEPWTADLRGPNK